MDSDQIARAEQDSRTLGRIFDIQRFSTQDGPGVRSTVFFKGCPLECTWCSNPESQNPHPQVMYFKGLCKGCGACAAACVHGACAMENGTLTDWWEKCTACGACVKACLYEARTLSGRSMSVDDVCEVVRKDWRTYMQSGGGITCGGGEALMQPEFLAALLARLHGELGYHTCLDTCGFAPWENLKAILPHLDLILLDIKHPEPEAHKRMTGVDNAPILHNALKLGAIGFPVLVRVPVIPGFNDDSESLEALGAFLRRAQLTSVELMAYHRYGLSKYEALGRKYQMADLPEPDLALALGVLEAWGLRVGVRR